MMKILSYIYPRKKSIGLSLSYILSVVCPFIVALLLLSSCRDDFSRISKSAKDQPSFSADTIMLDTLFSRLSSATHELKIYNRNKHSIRINDIRLERGNQGYRINVDGKGGSHFQSLVVLPGDSIFVFVEATFAEGEDDLVGEVVDKLLVNCQGIRSSVLLRGFRQNADHKGALIIDSDTTIRMKRPILIRDSLIVAPGATLHIEGGGRLCFYPKAYMNVYGRLVAEGQLSSPIRFEGERQDRLLADLPYRLIPGQWGGILFGEKSKGNKLSYCEIRNATNGIVFKGEKRSASEPLLSMQNSLLSNMKGYGLFARGGRIEIANSEISNTLNSSIALWGSHCQISSSSIINFYPWDSRIGPAILYYDAIPQETDGSPATSPKREDGSGLEIFSSVVDGSRATNESTGTVSNNRRGEMYILLADSSNFAQSVHISHSFLRIPQSYLVNGSMTNCTLPEDNKVADLKKDRYYLSLGYDTKPQKDKTTFVYDFRPLSFAPFVGKGTLLKAWPIDRHGIARGATPTSGCYEATHSKPQF